MELAAFCSARSGLAALLAAFCLAACAPRAGAPAPVTPAPAPPPAQEAPAAPPEREAPGETIVLTDPIALETDRAAREAFHLMELAYLETGVYSANILLAELTLPSGVRWMLEDLSETSYTLRITADALPTVAWFVTPEGVVARQVEDNRIR
jgi:hypothetical protein